MRPVVVAQSQLDALLSVIGRLTAPFRELLPGQDAVDRRVEGEPVLAGEVNGWAYLIEEAGTVFAVSWGLLARVARELDALVIGATFDPSEEHCEFFAARGPETVRAFWSNPRRATRPYSQGNSMPCEGDCPLSAPGGVGLTAALKVFGCSLPDDEGLVLLPGERWVIWQGDSRALLEADVLAEQVNNHVRAFPNPTYRWPVPVVRVRRLEE